VEIWNTNGSSGKKVAGFTYFVGPPATPPPTITSISPGSGSTAGGTPVTIIGSNFAAGAAVSLGGAAATNVVRVNSTTLTAMTAPRAAGIVNIVVTNPDGQSGTLANGYSYTGGNPAPTISRIVPATGPTAGGTPVTITGANFVNGATVLMGGTPALNVVRVNGSTITAVSPPHAAGAVNVIVVNPDLQGATLVNGFLYANGPLPAPAVSAISPSTGPTGGGTKVTVTGTNFVPGATLTLGDVAATNVVVTSPTTLTAVVGKRFAFGPVDVIVRNPDGQTARKVAAFFYFVGPAVN
jgi:hypothetical protein